MLNAVLGAPLLVAIALRVPTSRDPNPGPVDPLGVLLSVLGLGALVFGVIEGPERGWDSPLVLSTLVAGCVLLVGFVLWELRTKHPLLDPRLFRSPAFAAGSFAITLQFFAIFAFQFVSLQYLQQVSGYSALRAGLALLPIGIILGVLAPRAPQAAARFGLRAVVAVGSGLLAAGLLILAQLQVDSSYWHFLIGILVLGAGMALGAAPATEAILNGLPSSQQGLASAVNDTTRELGGALGIAVLGSLLNLGYRGAIDDRLADDGLREAARPSLQVAAQTAEGLGADGGGVLDAAQAAFVDGLQIAFYSGAGAVLIGTLVFLRLAPRRAPRQAPAPATNASAG